MRIWCLLSLATVGCSGMPKDYVVYIDPGLTTEQQQTVFGAMDDWMSNIPELRLRPTVSKCGDTDPSMCVYPDANVRAEYGHEGGATFFPGTGNISRSQSAVNVEALSTVGELQWGITHELGHGMGLEHTGAGTLMCWSGDCASTTVTPADVEQWRMLRR